MKRCGSCVHWKNHQRETNYFEDVGFCLCPAMNFNFNDGRLVGVVDLANPIDRSKVSGEAFHDFESQVRPTEIKHGRYLLTTNVKFGCILHESQEPKAKK